LSQQEGYFVADKGHIHHAPTLEGIVVSNCSHKENQKKGQKKKRKVSNGSKEMNNAKVLSAEIKAQYSVQF
jgi:hypothetical protein